MRVMSHWGVGPSILMYHSIEDNSDEPYTVSIDDFRQQVIWLRKNGFEIIPLSILLQSIRKQDYRKLRKKVVITFDDGYKDFITNALPILQEHNAPATVYLVTNLFGEKSAWNKHAANVQLMNEDEVRYIKEQGINLGSHTATHENLTLLNEDELWRQLKDSYDVLTRLGESFYSVTYPWGQWSPKVVDVIKPIGYECALVVGEKMRLSAENRYCLPRISMVRKMDINHFQSLLTRTNLEKEIRRTISTLRNRFE